MATWSATGRREASGVIDVVFTLAFGGNLDMEVLDIGDLNYEFDLPEDEEESKSIAMIVGDCEIEIRDVLSDGNSAYDLLTADANAINGDGDFVDYKGKIDIVTNSGNSYSFKFYFNKPDISTDDRTRKTQIKMHPTQGVESFVYQYFNGNIEYSNGTVINPFSAGKTIDVYGSQNTFGNFGVFALDFIEDMMKTLDADNTFVAKTNNLSLSKIGDATASNFYSYVIDDATLASGASSSLPGADSNVECFEVVGTLAASEGAIFGSGFGYNFFVNRNDATNNVQLEYNDLEDLSVVTTSRPFYSISVNYGVAAEANTTIYNRFSRKTFSYTSRTSLTTPANGFLYRGEYNGTDAATLSIRRITGNANVAVDAYASAFSADGSMHIETVIFGFDTVLPHQTFKFDSSVPSRYQSKEFRISSAEYSFKEDKISIKAYQIN